MQRDRLYPTSSLAAQEDTMLSIFLTLCGLYTLATGRLHSGLAGGSGYHVPTPCARSVGALLALAFPISLLLRLALTALMGETALMLGSAIEIATVVLALGAAFVVCRVLRQPAGR
jgi:hypothetical protein